MTTPDYFEGAPLGQMVYDRTYSRIKPDGTRETWPETVRRVVDGNLALVPPEFIEPNERRRLIELIESRQMLPAGRHLWMSGVPERSFLFNCHRAGWGSLARHAFFIFNELMKGGGVGTNYSQRYVSGMRVPASRVQVSFLETDTDRSKLGAGPWVSGLVIPVADSREGWVKALVTLINECMTKEFGWPAKLVFDLSKIRPKGSPIKTFGGIAAGPAPLRWLLESVAEFLNDRVGKPWSSLDLMAFDHMIAQCVISGNVRRSARMSILHWQDPEIWEFINCKQDTTEHWTTNISVEVDEAWFRMLNEGRPNEAYEILDAIVKGMLTNGEPGVFNSWKAAEGETADVACTNPCGEIALEEWENCNLGHVNLALVPTQEARVEAFRYMARFLVRATFTEIEDVYQKGVMVRNRRIGVGFFGLQEMCARIGWKLSEVTRTKLPVLMNAWKMSARFAANEYADQLGIARPVKVTCVAPTGTIAKLAGTSEGIQSIYSRYYIRRVRFSANDPLVDVYVDQGLAVEADAVNPGTVVVSFPTKDPVLDRVGPKYIEQANEILPAQQLALQVMAQRFYADNAISHTINLEPGRMDAWELRYLLLTYLPELKGITVMVDETRPQAPYTRITEEEYQEYTAPASLDDRELECAGSCPVR